MTHTDSISPASITERDYQDFVQRGNDFFKIELFSPAKTWYNKALELNDDATLKQQVAECDRKLAYERKVRLILAAVAVGLALVYFLFLR